MLLRYSEAKGWEDAKLEWRLVNIRFVDIYCAETCACGHYPICEICKIENVVNNTVLKVGNCCINQVSPEFDSLRRIFPALREGRINPAIIDYASKRGIITNWESKFLKNTWNRKRRTAKQERIFRDVRHKLYRKLDISPAQRKKIYEKWYGKKRGWDATRANAPAEATAQ